MAFTSLVVERRASLYELDKGLAADRLSAFCNSGEDILGEIDHRAAVAIGHGQQRLARIVVKRQRASSFCFHACQKRFKRSIVEAVEGQDVCAREDGRVDLE